MTNHETADPTAAIEVFARLLCSADIQVYGDEHPTWQKLSRKVQDDYRKAAAWLLPRMTVATRAAVVSVPPPAPRADDLTAVRALHQPMQRGPFTICGHCSGWDGKWRCLGVVTDYPCPTLRALDGEQQPVGPCVAGEQQNETPEGKPGCAHCGGDHSWDDCEAYTALVSEEQPPTDKEPEPGDRVRVTYEGTWLADDDPRTLLVGNHSGDIWRNIAPDHARVEVLPAVEASE